MKSYRKELAQVEADLAKAISLFEAMLATKYVKDELAYLYRGIGTATSHRVWLDAEVFIKDYYADIKKKQVTWQDLSETEVNMILCSRAKKETGFDIHKTDDGNWYIWKMGCQTHPKFLDQPTIGEAVHAFLKHYHPGGSNVWNSPFNEPLPRK